MGIEIERKFLIKGDEWRGKAVPVKLVQGYLTADKERTVRIRIEEDRGFITIKGKTEGTRRVEFEYPIPVEDANELLTLCPNERIEKNRTTIEWQGKIWEIDEFKGKNKGLILAEIELDSADEHFILPSWIGEEVSNDPRYYNSYLSFHPYSQWK